MDSPAPDTASELVSAIRAGDVDAVQRLVAGTPELVARPLGGPFKTRTALHVVADWPGYFPNGPRIVRVLVAAGADPDLRAPGDETPLHWAASSDDTDVAAALLDAGADIEAPDGSIGTPLDNAIGYSCWHVAALLAARGARVDKLWHAAALGMLDRLHQLVDTTDPTAEEVSHAFWHACCAAQRRTAEYLLTLGADLNGVPDHAEGTPLAAASGRGTRRDNVIGWLEERGAQLAAGGELPQSPDDTDITTGNGDRTG
ncbi:ankyrin repeat domain-containing protein [Streptomyces sp. SL13]|uniref:Ankyrin repeat domain-containing protein n=1 Tax=Streptantibioticus silvisoli TaxID=2705255 RepID=A0AA90JWA4_9ACTN|nr:ankyrin repeat domain-containing protein [Streptantibioticus silvisoli]MDI5968816.1 ankyrin repeat domain-containing protein [Streptantibioticus silvisoli]